MTPVTITKENFAELVERAEKPVLVDFWAPWCVYCRRIGPAVDQIAQQYDGQLVVGKVNIDEQPELAGRYGIMSIPTIIVFKNGEIAEQVVGAVNRGKLKEMLDRHIQQ